MIQLSLALAQRRDVRKILERAKDRNQVGARYLRRRGTDSTGQPFTGLAKATVWLNAAVIPGKDIVLWRQDRCGAHLYWHDYGKTNSQWGWEVDHITPIIHGGTDAITNLQALHWQNNDAKADRLDSNYCILSHAEEMVA